MSDETKDDEKGRALREAVRRLVLAYGALDDGSRPCGTPLPTPHAWALLELLHRGAMTVTDLSGCLNIDRTNVSRLCRRMESQGEVERVPNPDDGRSTLVGLTAHGDEVARSVDTTSARHFDDVLGALRADPDSVVEALAAVTDAISKANSLSARPA